MCNDKPLITVIVGPTASGKTDTAINLAKITNSEIINADSRQIYRELSIGTAKPFNSFSFPPLYSRGGLGRSSSLVSSISRSLTNREALPLTRSFKEGEKEDDGKIDGIVHYGFDLCSVKDDFNVGMFLDYFNEKAKAIIEKGKNVILTGGTGFYIDACMNGLANIPEIPLEIKSKVSDMILNNGLEYAVKILRENDKITQLDEKNPRRVARALEVFFATEIQLAAWHAKTIKNNDYNFVIFGLKLDREILYQRIDERVLKMLSDGMIDEAKLLKNFDLRDSEIKKAGIGYDHLIKFLDNEISLERATEFIQQDTRNYAKRQMTWFNRVQNVHWIEMRQKKMNEILDEMKIFP